MFGECDQMELKLTFYSLNSVIERSSMQFHALLI